MSWPDPFPNKCPFSDPPGEPHVPPMTTLDGPPKVMASTPLAAAWEIAGVQRVFPPILCVVCGLYYGLEATETEP